MYPGVVGIYGEFSRCESVCDCNLRSKTEDYGVKQRNQVIWNGIYITEHLHKNLFRRSNLSNLDNSIIKLSEIHLKLANASILINKIFSPLMAFSFGITFCMLCVFVFTLLFVGLYWTKLTMFAVTNAALYIHMFLTMLGVLWICDATVEDGNEASKLLFQSLNQYNQSSRSDTVSPTVREFNVGFILIIYYYLAFPLHSPGFGD